MAAEHLFERSFGIFEYFGVGAETKSSLGICNPSVCNEVAQQASDTTVYGDAVRKNFFRDVPFGRALEFDEVSLGSESRKYEKLVQ